MFENILNVYGNPMHKTTFIFHFVLQSLDFLETYDCENTGQVVQTLKIVRCNNIYFFKIFERTYLFLGENSFFNFSQNIVFMIKN